MAQRKPTKRKRGSIERRGGSFRVSVYAGIDPITGSRLYLRDSTTDETEAEQIRDRFLTEVTERRHAKTNATLGYAVDEWLKVQELEGSTLEGYQIYAVRYVKPGLGNIPLPQLTARTLEQFYAELRRCRSRCDGKPAVDHRTDKPHECRTIRHRRPPGRPPAGGHPPHDCEAVGCTVTTCPPHECKPLSNATILKIHFLIRGVLSAAVRWEWITKNPAQVARKPRTPTPQPAPPTADEAAQIISAAWEEDEQWGTLVWLVMVTGMRRAEVLALRWSDVDLEAGTITISRNYVRLTGEAVEKATKTNRTRRISIDPTTVEVLTEHQQCYKDLCAELDTKPRSEAFLFSYESTYDRPCDPSGVSHRYGRMCKRLGFDSHLHALRHYTATELLTQGVDLRTVAGRLGHAGGGATTLRVYAAWVDESDKRAASLLASKLQRPKKTDR